MMRKLPIFVAAICFLGSLNARADLPSPSAIQQQMSQGYDPTTTQQGYNPYYMSSYQNAWTSYQRSKRMFEIGEGASDLLWLFTNNEGTFGGRLFKVFANAVINRIEQPLANSLGAVTGQANPTTQTAQTTAQGANGTAYCYQCALQNSTNPYNKNPYALPPAVFGGSTSTTSTSGGGAGGIKK